MSGRRAEVPSTLVNFLLISADFAPLLAGPVLAPFPAPAVAPAMALASAATPAAALSAASGASVRPISATATTSLVPAAFTFSLNADTSFPFNDTPKLVSMGTSAPASTPAPAAPISMPRSTVIPSANTGLAVLSSKIFHHCFQLVCLWFFLPIISDT